jgi:LmbE family N-acetylglucosaminyl deacetylase
MTGPRTHLIVVAPHPDDETIGLGGTIHDHVRHGGTVEIVAVTDGEAADDEACESARAALANRRDCERERALHLLGAGHAEVLRLRLPDREVALHERSLADDLARRFAGRRRELGDCLVAVTWREDPHTDHRASARAAIVAARTSGVRLVEVPIWARYRGMSLPAHRAAYRAISPGGQRAKRAALQAFTSQTEPLPRGRGAILPPDFLPLFDQTHEVVLR